MVQVTKKVIHWTPKERRRESWRESIAEENKLVGDLKSKQVIQIPKKIIHSIQQERRRGAGGGGGGKYKKKKKKKKKYIYFFYKKIKKYFFLFYFYYIFYLYILK